MTDQVATWHVNRHTRNRPLCRRMAFFRLPYESQNEGRSRFMVDKNERGTCWGCTLKLRIEVSAAFAGRSGAIVATATGTRRNGAVIKARGQPCSRGMTDIALRGSLQVPYMLTNCDRSVVTAAATA